jgi:hypothetical protein
MNPFKAIFNPLSGNAPYYNILLCLMPDDFTRQVESAATYSMGSIALHLQLHLYVSVTLSNTNNFTCQQESTGAQWVNI